MAIDLEAVKAWAREAAGIVYDPEGVWTAQGVGHVEGLVAEVETLREALGGLVDEQNGPPLCTREEQWFAAVGAAHRAMGRASL